MRRLSCLPTRSLGARPHSATLPRRGRRLAARGALRRMADAGTPEKVAPRLGVGRTWRGGADRAQARRAGTWLWACTWHRPRLVGGGVVGVDPAPTGPCGRGGSAEPTRLSVWSLTTTSLRLRACAATLERETNFSETCGFLPALL